MFVCCRLKEGLKLKGEADKKEVEKGIHLLEESICECRNMQFSIILCLILLLLLACSYDVICCYAIIRFVMSSFCEYALCFVKSIHEGLLGVVQWVLVVECSCLNTNCPMTSKKGGILTESHNLPEQTTIFVGLHERHCARCDDALMSLGSVH